MDKSSTPSQLSEQTHTQPTSDGYEPAGPSSNQAPNTHSSTVIGDDDRSHQHSDPSTGQPVEGTSATDWVKPRNPGKARAQDVGPSLDNSGHATERIQDWIPSPRIHARSGQTSQTPTPRESVNMSSSSSSAGSRPNPKLAQTRRARFAAQQASRKVEYIPVKQVDGQQLFRLCNDVPYLLGPKSYIDTLNNIGSLGPNNIPPIKDHGGKVIQEENSLTWSGRLLAVFLIMIHVPEAERTDMQKQLTASVTTSEDKLHVWVNVGSETPEDADIDLASFLQFVRGWHDEPNPALVARHSVEAVTHWRDILQLIRKREIKYDYVDQAFYERSIRTPNNEQMIALLDEIQESARKREIEDREKNIRRGMTGSGLVIPSTFTYTAPIVLDRTVLYSTRFSHKHPHGELVDPSSARHDAYFDGPPPMHTKPTIGELGEQLKQRQKRWNATTCGRWTKNVFVTLAFAGIIAGILVLCYFRVGGRKSNNVS